MTSAAVQHDSPPRFLVIIPTYNEAENIAPLVEQILALQTPGADVEVLVVDDNSTDGTSRIVRGMQERFPRLHLICRAGKLGLGTAYLAGFDHALAHGFDFAFTMDADFSHNPQYIPPMIELALREGADLVIGSRYVRGGGVRRWGLHRKVLSFTANLLAHTALGLRARDCTSGFRCYSRRLLAFLRTLNVQSHGYSCLMELLFYSERAGARIAEHPIIFVDREQGASKVSKNEIFRALRTLRQLFPRRFQKTPVLKG
ncbi:MAG: polyprenol monophosphomannose synthase [Candidatus Sumerlaeia bacterium]